MPTDRSFPNMLNQKQQGDKNELGDMRILDEAKVKAKKIFKKKPDGGAIGNIIYTEELLHPEYNKQFSEDAAEPPWMKMGKEK